MTVELPRIVLGCGTFGGIGSLQRYRGVGQDRQTAFDLMSDAWTAGLRWFDTADAYAGGLSEEWIGEWSRTKGQSPAITTKTFHSMGARDGGGLAADRVARQIQASLGRLGVAQVDLYLAHELDPNVSAAELVKTFERLRSEGVIRSYGVSNVGFDELMAICRVGRPDVVQNPYSLLNRQDEVALVGLCQREGIRYQAYGPLAGGWLTGKYLDVHVDPRSRYIVAPDLAGVELEAIRPALEGMRTLADEEGFSLTALALAWVIARPFVDSVVIGPRCSAHLDAVLEATSVTLGQQALEKLEVLFPVNRT